jgi:hypothetical protein
MKFPRLAPFARILLLSLGAAGFVLAAVSLALDVVLLGAARHEVAAVPAPASAPTGITRWSELEPENPAAFAAHLRALGCPEEKIARLCENSAGEAQASLPAVSEPVRAEKVAAASAEENSVRAGAPLPATIAAPAMTTSAPQSGVATPSFGAVFATAESTPAQNSEASSDTTYSGSNVRARVRDTAASPYARTTAAAGGDTFAGAANTGTASSDSVIVAPAGNDVKIPLAYQPADPNLSLNETQRAQWTRLQDQFANQVTAAATPSAALQDGQSAATSTATPASATPDAKAWKTAQISNDEMFRILYGEDAWLRQQVQANLHKSDTGATTP